MRNQYENPDSHAFCFFRFLNFLSNSWKMNETLRTSQIFDVFLLQDSISHSRISWVIELPISRLEAGNGIFKKVYDNSEKIKIYS